MAFHRDLIVGMELQKRTSSVYKQPPETPDERRFQIFGAHEFIRSGPYGKDRIGRLVDSVGQALKAPTHAEIQAFVKARDRQIAHHRRIEKPTATVKKILLCKTFVKPLGIPAAAVTVWSSKSTLISGVAGPTQAPISEHLISVPISGVTRYCVRY